MLSILGQNLSFLLGISRISFQSLWFGQTETTFEIGTYLPILFDYD